MSITISHCQAVKQCSSYNLVIKIISLTDWSVELNGFKFTNEKHINYVNLNIHCQSEAFEHVELLIFNYSLVTITATH